MIRLLFAITLLGLPLPGSKPDLPKNLAQTIRLDPIDGIPRLLHREMEISPRYTDAAFQIEWQRNLPTLDRVSDLQITPEGYLVAGATLFTQDLYITLDGESLKTLRHGPGKTATHDSDLFKGVSYGIGNALFSYTPSGVLRWVFTFENDALTSGPVTRLHDGSLLFALSPLYLDQDTPLHSVILHLSKEGKLLGRSHLARTRIASMTTDAKGRVVAGGLKRSGKSTELRPFLFLLDKKGKLQKELPLGGAIEPPTYYDSLSRLIEHGRYYYLGGGNTLYRIGTETLKIEPLPLTPTGKGKEHYHVQSILPGATGYLYLLGYYGQGETPYLQTEMHRLQRMMNEEHLYAGYRERTSLLADVHAESLKRIEEEITLNRLELKAAVTPEWELINPMDMKADRNRHLLTGDIDRTRRLFIESSGGDKEAATQYILDEKGLLLLRTTVTPPYCRYGCRLTDEGLLYLVYDAGKGGYILSQGRFSFNPKNRNAE